MAYGLWHWVEGKQIGISNPCSCRTNSVGEVKSVAAQAEWGSHALDFPYRYWNCYSASQIDVRVLGRSIPIQELPFYSRDIGGDAVAPTRPHITLI